MRRRFVASNRHWVFAKQHILGPLNDQLAQRHGAEYTLEVPESSFDWDVEFSVIKDRSGNTLREQYMAAWVQPSLVAPGEKIYQLGARVNWHNPDVFGKTGEQKTAQFDQNEVAALMAKVDEIIGSPIKVEEKEEVKEEIIERPTSVTNQGKEPKETLTLSSVNKIIRTANELVKEAVDNNTSTEAAKVVFDSIKIVNDAKKLDSVDSQQLEVQDAYDKLDKLKSSPSTALLGFIGTMICDKIRQGTYEDQDIYDILSRLTRQVSDSITYLGKAPDYKLQAINDIETMMINLFDDASINNSVQSCYSDIKQEQLMKYLDDAYKQLDALRNMSLKLNISDIPAPQVVDQYVEEIKENPPA